MFEHPADLFFLLSFCSVIFFVAAAGVLALPWKDDELVETTRAIRQGWAWLDAGLQKLGQRAAHVARTHDVFDAPTHSFDRPTASRAA